MIAAREIIVIAFPGITRASIGPRKHPERSIARLGTRDYSSSSASSLGLPPPGSSGKVPAQDAIPHPSRNRPLLSGMDPNKLARSQPKLCYWSINSVCGINSGSGGGGCDLPTCVKFRSREYVRAAFERSRANRAARDSLSVGRSGGRKCYKFAA